ncbi:MULTISPECIES: hypothetical protein [Pseudoalteromonas]|uniref:hypothetical protein n=1 Tax=Pseudoalteromonas TaxID=53246 RepID=UPI00051D9D26|nr:hypothetical protein [Pseudoalteromonas sp. ND6B]KGJ99740.1 hypothetical protein ND6B_2567 [Pseudoalteromonas sp. ND6B]
MKKQLLSGLVFTSALSTFNVFATNGYFTHGYGMTHKGMAGAGVALSEELMSGANNPATFSANGTQMSVGIELFAPERNYTAAKVDEYFPNALYLDATTKKVITAYLQFPNLLLAIN